jgi:hypothetical protein
MRRNTMAGMADEHQNKKLEINVADGKFVSENTWDDILPAVKPGVAALGNLLGVAANATGLTAEIVNDVIDNMRRMYREQVFRIPEEHRRRPPYRITSEVLEQTVKCVEESDLHRLFVNLLIAASDDRRTGEAHPGFAKAIGQLTPLDAKVVRALRGGSFSAWPLLHNGICSRDELEVSQINLIQLGIAEWEYERLNSFFISSTINKFGRVNVKIPRQTGAPNHWSSSMENGKPEGLEEAARNLAENLQDEIKKTQNRTSIKLTDYGRLFAKACLDAPTQEGDEARTTD